MAVLAALFCLARPARAQDIPPAQAPADYDPTSTAWNGLSTLLDIARSEGVDLQALEVVDFRHLRPTDALLVVYPQGELPRGDILRFLRRGGRVAIADDFGSAGALLHGLDVHRTETGPTGGDRLHGNPELPVARPRAPHPLTDGVDALVTNHAAFLTSRSEPPIEPAFDYGTPEQAAVIAGVIKGTETGAIAVLGDPSVLINNMLEHPGNRRFARNLLRYLGASGGRVVLVHGEFGSIGTRGAGAPPVSPGAMIAAFDGFLRGLASVEPPGGILRVLALLAVLTTFLSVALLVPLAGHRYDGRWLRPGHTTAAAGFLGKIEIFRGKRASYLYPALVLRRDLEVRLVEALRLEPPVTVDAILDALARRGVPAAPRTELRRLLESLDRLQVRADRGSVPPRVSARRLGRLADAAEHVLGLAAGMRTGRRPDRGREPRR